MEDNIVPVVQTEEQPDNLLSVLAGKRKELSENKETFLPVPGYDKEPPLLLIKYRLLDGTEIDKLGNKIRREFKGRWDRTLYAAVDIFIAACGGIYVDLGEGDPPQQLKVKGQPVTGFTRDLAEGLDFVDRIDNPDRARDVVFGLFANNDVAITGHYFLLNRWMGDTTIDVQEEMYGGNL
jgi:hypothetical protein